MNLTNKVQQDYIDIIKGIGIFLVASVLIQMRWIFCCQCCEVV